MKKQLFLVAHADRIGGTTYCKNLAKQYYNSTVVHFGPPKFAGDLSHYWNTIMEAAKDYEVIVCDRHYREAPFFDSLFRNYHWDDANYSQLVGLQECLEIFFGIYHINVFHEWDETLIHRHQLEINAKIGGPQADFAMAERAAQHHAYYDHMANFEWNRIENLTRVAQLAG